MGGRPGFSVRLKLTVSYAGFLMIAGALLLAAVWVFLLRYVPERALMVSADNPGIRVAVELPRTTSGGGADGAPVLNP